MEDGIVTIFLLKIQMSISFTIYAAKRSVIVKINVEPKDATIYGR